MLVNDVMHEWEGGIVKRVIAFLVRLVHAADNKLPAWLDERFVRVNTTPEMSNISLGIVICQALGQDFASFLQTFRNSKTLPQGIMRMLYWYFTCCIYIDRNLRSHPQCSINAFCGLLPLAVPALAGLQETILDALYIMATFHSLSKLHLHTSTTLELLEDVTKALGDTLRTLRDKSAKALTVTELSRDVQARVRNQNRRLQKQASTTSAPPTQKKVIALNLSTIKNHLLEHYRGCIELFGTTDGYSTSIVS